MYECVGGALMARGRRRSEPHDIEQDPYLLLVACAAAGTRRVERQVAEHGFPALRRSHGYLVQHLVPGPADANDARVRAVALAEHGWAAVHAARTARRELRDDLHAHLGAERYEQFRAALVEVAAWSGGLARPTERALAPGE